MEAVIIETKPSGITVINGRECMLDGKGQPIPVVNIAPADKLQDELVRKVMGFAIDLSAQVSRFREHTMFDLASFDALLAQEYGAKIGGPKGNRTYQSFDGLMKVNVQIADRIEFGPELQIAKSLLDECIIEWSAAGDPGAGDASLQHRQGGPDQPVGTVRPAPDGDGRRALEPRHGCDPGLHAGRGIEGVCAVLPAPVGDRRLAGGHHRPGQGVRVS
jgi:hypothetical protein